MGRGTMGEAYIQDELGSDYAVIAVDDLTQSLSHPSTLLLTQTCDISIRG